MLFGKKWFWMGLAVAVAVLNPIFSGIILGSLYLTEPGLKKYGRVILPVAVVWGVIAFWLAKKFSPAGLI